MCVLHVRLFHLLVSWGLPLRVPGLRSTVFRFLSKVPGLDGRSGQGRRSTQQVR